MSESVDCPFCGSRETEILGLFGQQLLTAPYYCNGCRTPFERVRGSDVVEDARRRTETGDRKNQ